MVVTSPPDGPATNIHTKTLTPTDTTPPIDVNPHQHGTLTQSMHPTSHRGLQGHSLTNAEDRSFMEIHFKMAKMAKHLPMKLTLSLILKVFSTNMLWTQIKNSWD